MQTVVQNEWYQDLVQAGPAQCTAIRAGALPDEKTGLFAFGAELYLAAAEACLGHWPEAANALALQPDRPVAGPDSCGKPYVYDWVQALLAAHGADALFVPTFEDAVPAAPCTP